MAVQMLSPSRSSSAIETLADEEARRMNATSSSSTPFTYPTSRSNSSTGNPQNGLLGEPVMMDRQRSSSRMSLRPSYETLNTGASSTSLSMSPSSTTVNGSIISAAPSVAAIGKVNVTDPWGTAWGMDSPYDASVAYASNPNRLTMRQSAYFGSGLTLAALAGGSPYNHHPGATGQHTGQGPASSSSLHPNQATAASSPAPSSFSSISGSASANTNVWSEASSTNSSSAFSSFNGHAPPPAPWVHDSNGPSHGKRRSVSFQGDLSQFANGGVPSPTYSTQSEGLPPSSSSLHHQHPHHPIPPNLRARSTTHLPSLIHHRQSGIPLSNRRTNSTPGSESDRSAFRKSFIGGSVVNQSGVKETLPPVPVDPKVLAKMSSKKSLKSGNNGAGNGATASSRASIMSATTEAHSIMSGMTQDSKKSKRKSWFARTPSTLSTAGGEPLSAANSSIGTSASTHSMLMGRSNRRQSTGDSSSDKRPPSLSRASSSFGTNMSSPPPPTPPIPDTLPLPPSLGDKSRKSSTASLRQRVHAGSQPHSGASTPSPGLIEMMPSPNRPHSATSAGNSSNNAASALNPANVPATPLSARLKTSPTPSLYGTPIASPSNALSGAQQANNILASTAPVSSSPLSMSPMTSPTSAMSHPLKPAALAAARPAALQLSTLSENTMYPDSFPSPGTHHDALRRAEAEGLASSTRTAKGNSPAHGGARGGSSYIMPAQPAVTMSLPPTPLTEATPIDDAQKNALAPAAVIRPSPSSPPALGSLAALAHAERTNTRSPTATPSSTRGRASPSGLPPRKDSRPNTPIDQVLHQGNQSISTIQAVNIATPRSTSQASTDARSTYASPPTSIASRKRSNNSLKATLSQAPPSPEPSSAIVEHVSAGTLLNDDDQFLPFGAAMPPVSPMSTTFEQPAPQQQQQEAEAAPPIPHQPGLDTSLSSFQVRKAFPDHRHISTLPVVPMPRKSSTQSIQPETVPLPDSPALGGSGFDAPPPPAAHVPAAQMQAPLQPRSLAPQQPMIQTTGTGANKLKPRASSPNLQAQNGARGKSAAGNNGQAATLMKQADTPARKSSKSPFSLFKRSRSKTLGDGSTSPSEVAAAHLYAPPPALPAHNGSLHQSQDVPAESPSQPTSAQMTPAPTPQLSFSSSTTSTMAGSEPSDQFYADFAPASRPSFSKNDSSSSGNITINANSPDMNKSLGAGPQQQHQISSQKQPLTASKSQNTPTTGKSKGFSRMFGTSSKRKA